MVCIDGNITSCSKLNHLLYSFYRWGFLIACLLAVISILFFGSLFAMTGLSFIIQPFVQMIGGFLHPGKPMANMYFVLFSYSESPTLVCVYPRCSIYGKLDSVTQAELLLRDLKIAQCESTTVTPCSVSHPRVSQIPNSLLVQRSQPRSLARYLAQF